MTKSSPLDTLKHTALRADDFLDYLEEHLILNCQLDEHDTALDILQSIRQTLAHGLGEHVEGVTFDGLMRVTRDGTRRLYRYDDGSPVRVAIDEGTRCWTVYPRLEPDLLESTNRLRLLDPAFAELVAEIEGEDG